MENCIFPFSIHLPGPLSFSTALENNTIFLQQFFRFRGGGFPLPPAGAHECLGSQTGGKFLIAYEISQRKFKNQRHGKSKISFTRTLRNFSYQFTLVRPSLFLIFSKVPP